MLKCTKPKVRRIVVYKVISYVTGIGYTGMEEFKSWKEVEMYMFDNRYEASEFIVMDENGNIIDEVKGEEFII
jgi:hypothetical protein